MADKNFDESYPVVCGGGIVTAYPDYLERIRLKSPKRAKLILATRPPIFGAAVEAMHRSGFEIDESFKTTFMADFNRMKDGV